MLERLKFSGAGDWREIPDVVKILRKGIKIF